MWRVGAQLPGRTVSYLTGCSPMVKKKKRADQENKVNEVRCGPDR